MISQSSFYLYFSDGNDVEHLLVCWSVICVSRLWRNFCLCTLLISTVDYLSFYFWVVSFDVTEYKSLISMWFAKSFLPFFWFFSFFTLLIISLEAQKFQSLMKFNLCIFLFCFCFCCFISLIQGCASKGFIALALTLSKGFGSFWVKFCVCVI